MQSPLEIPCTSPVDEIEHTVGVEDSNVFNPPLSPAELVTEIDVLAPTEIADTGLTDNV